MLRRLLAIAAVVGVVVAQLLAHETWVLPTSFVAKAGSEVRLDVTSGVAFPRVEFPIRVDRVAAAAFRIGAVTGELSDRKTEEKSLVLCHMFAKEGVATVWLDLKPKAIALADDKVAEYLDEIDATEDVRALWTKQKGRTPWKETYTKHAKTFVTVGAAPSDKSWSTPIDAALEFVPVTDPLTVVAGQDFTVQLLSTSKPVARLPVGLLVEGVKDPVFKPTDSEGRSTFKVAGQGFAMVFTVQLRFDESTKEWQSDFCTMTFEARPKS